MWDLKIQRDLFFWKISDQLGSDLYCSRNPSGQISSRYCKISWRSFYLPRGSTCHIHSDFYLFILHDVSDHGDIGFSEVLKEEKNILPFSLTLFVNRAIKPFTMYAISLFFLALSFSSSSALMFLISWRSAYKPGDDSFLILFFQCNRKWTEGIFPVFRYFLMYCFTIFSATWRAYSSKVSSETSSIPNGRPSS